MPKSTVAAPPTCAEPSSPETLPSLPKTVIVMPSTPRPPTEPVRFLIRMISFALSAPPHTAGTSIEIDRLESSAPVTLTAASVLS